LTGRQRRSETGVHGSCSNLHDACTHREEAMGGPFFSFSKTRQRESRRSTHQLSPGVESHRWRSGGRQETSLKACRRRYERYRPFLSLAGGATNNMHRHRHGPTRKLTFLTAGGRSCRLICLFDALRPAARLARELPNEMLQSTPRRLISLIHTLPSQCRVAVASPKPLKCLTFPNQGSLLPWADFVSERPEP
jgi:hypothetical protein